LAAFSANFSEIFPPAAKKAIFTFEKSKFSKLPNSLNPKEIHYTTQVVHSSDKYS